MPDDAREVLIRYGQCFRQHHGDWPAPINWPKDMKLAKSLLESYTPQQLTKLVEHFFEIDDAFIQQSGYTFGVFKACIGKVLVSYQRQARLNVIANQQKEQIEREAQQRQEWWSMTPEQRQRKLAEG